MLVVPQRLFSVSRVVKNSSSSGFPGFNFNLNQLLNSNLKFLPNIRKKSIVHDETAAIDTPKKLRIIENRYKRSTHPTSVPLNKLFSNNFPLSISDSIDDYAYRRNPLKFQHDLLSLLPFYPQADSSGRSSQALQVKLDSGNYINEFVIYPPNKTEADASTMNHLIMIHGYGGGLGFFLKNFDEISSLDNWCIHSIDLLGYGCSSRPPFKLAKDDLEHVEKWFHDSYTEWLIKRNLSHLPPSQVLVMGHSMGAYLMATYGVKVNPKFCRKLLMISPGAVIKHRKQIFVPKYFAKLWEQNISPFTLVRKAGPLGSKVVSGWSSRRFANLPSKESKLLHKYAYGIFQSPGSGEYMLNYLLAPGADARFPLVERDIHKLDCEVLWCYGKEDWMDKLGGELCSKLINRQHKDSDKSKVLEIDDSGHHIYLDNPKKFNKLLLDEMKKF
ncbi:DEHA2G05104p [Debaryomyces hansenii CBS767]|uniref:DEHA2G05104p n=1 Tax=Debaryomyces hansenii (strain ATCC 36239 / CBS 767 / BCRC 21394 / JCM 1990 / NBRC 0083 / IGC 2968) TaxID=284592 RepID=Q6BJ53_DEBHA|nr:DEHA2G05104p [Debaryomyces hansenii CBS767]CAG90225.2 DEHA2G05104p [Debaryomyces hansenii CBS767]|eukprot:XP_461768.2 DEHA2G05104p [Debaryomyces hansenii CBS767]